MGEEDGKEALSFSALKLESLQMPFTGAMDSPEHPSTPPFQASAAVPFKWEEQPGKPRPCSDTITRPPAKSLELPPCMADRFTKTPSPTTVLDGPYPKFSSFRFFRDAHVVDSSFDGSPEGTAFDALLKSAGGVKSRGFFGKFKASKRELYGGGGGSCRFSPSSVSSCDSDERFAGVKNNCGVKLKITRNGSFSTIHSHAKSSQSHLWTSIYQGIKQVMQWKSSKKSNKQGRD